jgi:AcrR family transcriptional regulator
MPPSVQPGRRGRKPIATIDDVVETSLDLIDREGLAALSIRRLMHNMRMGPMTFYGYFASKEHLLEAIMVRAFEVDLHFDAHLGWQDRLRVAVRSLQAAAARHPGALELLMSRSVSFTALDPFRNMMVQTLLDAGFDERESVQALRLLMSHLVGFVLGAVHQRSSPGEAAERLLGLDPDVYGAFTRVASAYASPSGPPEYERDLGDLIAILERRLEVAVPAPSNCRGRVRSQARPAA